PLPRTLYSSMWCASVGGGAAASTYRYLLSRLSASSVNANSPFRTGVLAKNFRPPLGAIPYEVVNAPVGAPPPVLTTNAYLPLPLISTQQGAVPLLATVLIGVSAPDEESL